MGCGFGKKVTALFMAAVVSVSLAPLSAFAADDQAFSALSGAVGQVSAQAATSSRPLSAQAKKLTESQTALGLFKYIRNGSTKGSAAYVDAQCAIDILTGKTTSGVSYPSDQGPEQDGWTTAMNGAKNKNAYKKVDLTNANDAASLANFEAALGFIDEYNKYRAKENKAEGTKLATNVGMNCRMMAISIVQCDWSKSTFTHSRIYNVGENLAWGYAAQSPFAGWYTAEKKVWKSKGSDASSAEVGHYLNIVDHYGTTTATGFAVNANDATYGICHEQTFFTGGSPNITYSTSQFRTKWLNKYKKGEKVVAAKAVNPMKVTVKKPTVKLKAKALKKKAKKLSNIKVSKAQGKVTCKNVSKNKKAKKFKITSKGKVKVTKGLKKGKYKVIVKVKAAGNASYKAATKKVKFTVRVK